VKGDILFPLIYLIANKQNQESQDPSAGNYCSFTIEKLLKKRHSLQLTYNDNWYSQTIANNWYNKSTIWSLIPEYKFFVSKKKLCSGYYIGAYGKYSHDYENNVLNQSGWETNIERYKEVSLGGGISNGVQFYLFKRITIDVLLGIGILKPINYNVIQVYEYDLNNGTVITTINKSYRFYYDARLAINIGFKF
jgi:hypothetical protein